MAFFCQRLSVTGAEIDITRLLPEHVGLLAEVAAADAELMAITAEDLAA